MGVYYFHINHKLLTINCRFLFDLLRLFPQVIPPTASASYRNDSWDKTATQALPGIDTADKIPRINPFHNEDKMLSIRLIPSDTADN